MLILKQDLYDVKPLPAGCCLNALFDSCYSGSVLDLPYIYQPSDHLKQHAANSRALTKYPQAHVVLFASCSDFQGSGGVIIRGGEFLGAMSSAFISSLTTNPTQTYSTCVCAGYLTSDSEADAAAVEFVSN
ncbi:hypothetical protein C8R48DRAFT_829621 [Suillus tomentosus]|nr:hypothetical protein C8R48DRAFT_829621 [Suillus tomentosus]